MKTSDTNKPGLLPIAWNYKTKTPKPASALVLLLEMAFLSQEACVEQEQLSSAVCSPLLPEQAGQGPRTVPVPRAAPAAQAQPKPSPAAELSPQPGAAHSSAPELSSLAQPLGPPGSSTAWGCSANPSQPQLLQTLPRFCSALQPSDKALLTKSIWSPPLKA